MLQLSERNKLECEPEEEKGQKKEQYIRKVGSNCTLMDDGGKQDSKHKIRHSDKTSLKITMKFEATKLNTVTQNIELACV
jgi:hypothetical protein